MAIMHILELAQDTNKVTGRRYVKFVIHEIFDNPESYQDNGISWNAQYTQNNIGSATGMPLCVEFIDYDRSEPYGHGLTGMEDNKPVFESSTVVGIISNAYIDNNLVVNEKKIKALVGEGYIYEQRYPKFVQWLKSQKYDKKPIESSIEVCAKAGNETIIYDGGWKEKGRVPQIYDYTGHAIVGIEPADDSAVLLELNNLRKSKEENSMATPLDPKDQALLDLNVDLRLKTSEVNTLSISVSDKDKELKEVNTKLESVSLQSNAKDETIKALNLTIETNAKKIADQDVELNQLREFKVATANKELVVELNSKLSLFTDKEKLVVKAQVDAFASQPSPEKIVSIVSEINQAIATQVLEARKGKGKTLETNSKANIDIENEMLEINTDEDEQSIY
jgi:hypothetical protein